MRPGRSLLGLVVAAVLVQRSSAEDLTAADRAFGTVCRDHGPPRGVQCARGRRRPRGRVKQAAQERLDPEDGRTPKTFTWHPRSGICAKPRT